MLLGRYYSFEIDSKPQFKYWVNVNLKNHTLYYTGCPISV